MYRWSWTWENCSQRPSLDSAMSSMKIIGESGRPCLPKGDDGVNASGNFDVMTLRYQFHVPRDASPFTSVESTCWPSPLR